MSSYKSSNSLQNSIHSYSFPRQIKFNGTYKNSLSQTLFKLPDSKSTKYTTLGFGNRYDFSNPNGKDSPGPSYKVKSCFEKSVAHKKGPLILEKFNYLVITFLCINYLFSL
jgi:hypothetical protein